MEELRLMGMPAAEIAKARVEALARWGHVADAFTVHPANGRAVGLFLGLSSQWRQVSLQTMQMAQVRSELIRVGLDYGVIETTARMQGLGEVTPDDFVRLRCLEAEAMLALSEAREQRQ